MPDTGSIGFRDLREDIGQVAVKELSDFPLVAVVGAHLGPSCDGIVLATNLSGQTSG